MSEYEFGPDEYVVLKAQQVHLDKGRSMSLPHGSELMLTNRNIVLVHRGMTGKVKGYDTYPLANLRMVDGKPQCRLDESQFMTPKLELSMNSGMVSFVFGSLDNEKEIRQWINAIYQILVGYDAPAEALGAAKHGVAAAGDKIIGTFERAFESMENALESEIRTATGEVSVRCPSCGASVKGIQGSTITCPYCETYVTL